MMWEVYSEYNLSKKRNMILLLQSDVLKPIITGEKCHNIRKNPKSVKNIEIGLRTVNE